MPKWVGPFVVTEKIGPVAYRLDLSGTLPIHDVFHASLLKPYKDGGRQQPAPPPLVVGDTLEYEVDKILAHRDVRFGPSSRKPKREYLVSWTGYGPEYNLWLGESECQNCPEKIQQYWDGTVDGDTGRRKRRPAPATRQAKKPRG